MKELGVKVGHRWLDTFSWFPNIKSMNRCNHYCLHIIIVMPSLLINFSSLSLSLSFAASKLLFPFPSNYCNYHTIIEIIISDERTLFKWPLYIHIFIYNIPMTISDIVEPVNAYIFPHTSVLQSLYFPCFSACNIIFMCGVKSRIIQSNVSEIIMMFLIIRPYVISTMHWWTINRQGEKD